ncbi:hypothetical protein F4821DRAFT_275555 [Hypoxylon rubiginosum]|uniref:Uncharacterized protein n=1 Tax=Hypoxylon rubiginosum TaxID=110542 RepID=A0ACC0DBI9_9PEZI|nr:hypothetical protein F4821DRAFT_275555 [Hypoxylon rubiginosum]
MTPKMRTAQTSKAAKAPKPSKATKQAKACGLSISTTQTDSPVHSVQRDENVKERLDSALARTFASKRKAILNDNWRDNQLDRRVYMPAVTAAPEQTEFQLTQSMKNIKKLSIDTDRASDYGLRRYRDTPIDPDLIQSAPLANKDYGGAHDKAQAHHTEEPQEPMHNAAFPTPPSAATSPETPMSADIQVPLSADITVFESAKQLHWNKWDTIPHTAGLPMDRLRFALDEASTMKVVLEEGLFEVSPSMDKKKDEQERFDALIAKLHKSRLASGRRRIQSYIDIKPPHWTKESGKSDIHGKSPSPDSAVSGVSDEVTKKGPVLNPQAIEFHSSISPGVSSSSNLCQQERKEISSQLLTFHDSSSRDSNSSNDSALVEEMRQMNARVAEVMEEMKQIKAYQLSLQHSSYPIEQSRNPAFNIQAQYGQGQGPAHAPTPASLGQYGPAPWSAVQPYNVPQHSLQQPMQQPQFSHYPHHLGPNGGMPNAQPWYPTHPQGQQLQKTSSPDRSRSRGPEAPMAVGPHAGYGPLPLHAQAQMVFGPKPVSKPRGDFCPGDPRATAQQVAYEAYLEQKRASDLSYAMQCRDRQARRAERQRTATGKFNTPPKALSRGPQANA